jgi:AcrR family transcriptional regulator
MTDDESKNFAGRMDTRLRILDSARKLFSLRGFAGTSVREIARESQVNLSAINYHFQSKESLYWALMVEMHRSTYEHMRLLAAQSQSLLEYSHQVFAFFLSDPDFVRSIMKLKLSDMPVPSDDPRIAQELAQHFGPPGSEFFADLIQKELSYPLSSAGKKWGAEVIFNQITQTAMMLCSHFCSLDIQGRPAPTQDEQKQSLTWLIESTLNYMEQRADQFRS